VLVLCLVLGPIAAIFWHNEEFAMGLGRDIVLDGVVCVVDAIFGEQVLFIFFFSTESSSLTVA